MSDREDQDLAERVREAARRAAERQAAGPNAGMLPIRDRAPREREGRLDDLSRVNNELVSAQRELAARNAELAALDARKNQLLGMVAHDLRNPLGTIRGFAELLAWELEDDLDEDRREMLREIVDSSERLSRMIDDLLDANAVQAGQLSLQLRPDVDLAAVVAATARLHRSTAARKDIVVRHVADADQALVRADAGKLGQVASNLVNNAVKYSHRGTIVTTRVSVEGGEAVLRVRDQGQGMDADDLARLFTAYGTTSAAPTAGERSIGLGLAIVRAIVEGHGGSIGVTSEVGVGSEFVVRLPRQRDREGSPPASPRDAEEA